MPTTWKTFAKISLAVTALAAAYWAGAETQAQQNVQRLDQTHDLLAKARALLNTVQSRASYGAVEAAKAKVDGALQDIATARKQNGGQ